MDAPQDQGRATTLRLRWMAEMVKNHPGADLTNAWDLAMQHGSKKPNTLLMSLAQQEATLCRELHRHATAIEWKILEREMKAS